MDNVIKILKSFDAAHPNFPPTHIYNEGWMLRILLDWFSKYGSKDFFFHFHENAQWFSEALLPTTFKARYRGDKLAESRTNADGVVGHFKIGLQGKADLSLLDYASQFVIMEAKLGSKLSSGTTNAPGYDQAARNAACMAEVLCKAGRYPDKSLNLGFYLLAPQSKIAKGAFPEMANESILKKVKKRVEAYGGEKDAWYRDWFLPTMENLAIRQVSWEELIAFVTKKDNEQGKAIEEFYSNCLAMN